MSAVDILGDGSCVALYEFEDNALDSGGQYNGEQPYGVTYGDGVFGKGAVLNGAAFIRKAPGYGIPINNIQVKTVSCWFNASSSRKLFCVWSSGKRTYGASFSSLQVDAAGNLYHAHVAETYTYTDVTEKIPYDTWVFCAISGDTVYLNGRQIAKLTHPIGEVNNAQGFYIGAQGAYDYQEYLLNASYGMPIIGSIDNLRIFNKVLSPIEVDAVFCESTEKIRTYQRVPSPMILSMMPTTPTRGFR